MTLFEAVWNSLPHAKLVKSHAEHKINFNDRLRSPQALHKVLAPSGPRRHSGVSVVLQEWHRWPSVLRFYIAMYSNHYLVFSLLRCIPLTVLRLYFGRESWDIRAWRIAAYSESSSCTYKKQGYPYLSGLHSVSSHQKLASFWMSLSPPASSGSKQDADLFREFCCCCARLDASKVDKLDSMSLLIRAALSKSDTLRSDGVSRSLHLSSLLQSPVHRLMI